MAETLRGALERVMGLANHEAQLRGIGGGNWAGAYRDLQSEAVDIIRTHGHALLAAVRDGERYAWLRERHVEGGPDWHVRRPSNDPAEHDLDAAVDAAMLESRQP